MHIQPVREGAAIFQHGGIGPALLFGRQAVFVLAVFQPEGDGLGRLGHAAVDAVDAAEFPQIGACARLGPLVIVEFVTRLVVRQTVAEAAVQHVGLQPDLPGLFGPVGIVAAVDQVIARTGRREIDRVIVVFFGRAAQRGTGADIVGQGVIAGQFQRLARQAVIVTAIHLRDVIAVIVPL